MESKGKVNDELSKTIKLLPEHQQEQLLIIAKSFLDEKRKHQRQTYIIHIDYSDKNRLERGIIQNISAGGICIQPSVSFMAGQSIIMTFNYPDSTSPIKIKGNIVWKDEKGMGIKFDEEIDLQRKIG